jgi:stage II sporulation protein P
MASQHNIANSEFANALIICLTGFLIFMALCAGWLSPKNRIFSSLLQSTMPAQIIRSLLKLDSQVGRSLLNQGIPMLAHHDEDDIDLVSNTRYVDLFLQWALDIRYASPQEILRVQLPYSKRILKPTTITKLKNKPRLVVHESPAILPDSNGKSNISLSTDPQVLVFHTHTSESYLPTSSVEHKLNDRGDIVDVGRYLANELNELGVLTLHADKIHDQYPFRDSYIRSHETVNNLLTENPSIKVVLDIHRDATPGLPSTVNINGSEVAGISFVIGSDRIGLPHPNWQKNYQFALELADALDRHYNGIVLKVIRADARYNQHLHKHAVIVEIGNQHSSLEQAKIAAKYLAEVLQGWLKNYPLTDSQLPLALEDSKFDRSDEQNNVDLRN